MQGTLIDLSSPKSGILHKLKNIALISMAVINLISCGGGGGGSVPAPPEKIGTVAGSAFMGLVESGEVNVYSLTSGVRGAAIAKSIAGITLEPTGLKGGTIANPVDVLKGAYTAELQIPSQTILVCLSNARYREMTQDRLISFDVTENQELCAVENYISGSSIKVTLSYYSHLASGLAKYLILQGNSPTVAVTKANQEIGNWVQINVNQDEPVNITAVSTPPSSLEPTYRAGFANAAISVYSGWVNGVAGIPPTSQKRFERYNSILFAQRAYADISSDGLLDGQSADGPVGMGPVTIKTSTYRHDIALDMLVMMNSSRNTSGIDFKAGNLLGAAMFQDAKSYSFFDHPDSIDTPRTKLNIFDKSTEGVILDNIKPVLNNIILPKVLTGDVTLAISLTDVKNEVTSVEYRFINTRLNINDSIKLFSINADPAPNLSRTVTSLATNSYADGIDYELQIIVNYTSQPVGNPIILSKTNLIIGNTGTKIVGPVAVTNATSVHGVFNLIASVTNPNGIRSISLEIDGVASTTPVRNFTRNSIRNVAIFRINSRTLINGSHDFMLKVIDSSGLESLSQVVPLNVRNFIRN